MNMNQDQFDEKIFNVLLAPRQTEKSTLLEMYRQYVFQVKADATKAQIKEAVEKLFGVIVLSVRVCNTKGKVKRFGQIIGRRKPHKKAYVMLKEGHSIKFGGA